MRSPEIPSSSLVLYSCSARAVNKHLRVIVYKRLEPFRDYQGGGTETNHSEIQTSALQQPARAMGVQPLLHPSRSQQNITGTRESLRNQWPNRFYIGV